MAVEQVLNGFLQDTHRTPHSCSIRSRATSAAAGRAERLAIFSLKGTVMPPDPPSNPTPPDSDSSTTTADLENGRKIFADSCSACHGVSGEGGHGPSLRDVRDVERIVHSVRSGGSQMPSFGSKFSEREIRDVSAYVSEKLTR